MLVVSVVVAFIAFGVGVVLGLMWGPVLVSKKYQEMFLAYQKQLQEELDRVRVLQEQVTQEYQEKIQKDLNNYLLITATPPGDKEEMN